MRIEAEDYAGYYDVTTPNQGGSYRNDGVDIEATSDSGGGYNVGWISQGEWLTYDVNVPEAGAYALVARVASRNDGPFSMKTSIDGQDTTLSFTGTGGWQSWKTVSGEEFVLSAGTHQLRLDMLSNGFNVNYIELIPVSTNPPLPNPDPQPGMLAFDNASINVDEGGAEVSIAVTRTGGADGAVSAWVNLAGGSAGLGDDFSGGFPLQVDFANGEGGAKTLTIPIVDDSVDEADETIELSLGRVTGEASLGAPSTTTVTIRDNDAPLPPPGSDPEFFSYGSDEQILLLSDFNTAAGWQLDRTSVVNGELVANPRAEWAQAHFDLASFNYLDLAGGDVSLYWRARADRSQPERAKFFVELDVLDNPIVDGHDEDREVKMNIRPVAPSNGNFNSLPYLLYLDPGWQIPHEVEAELQVPDEFETPNTYENFRLTLRKTDADTVTVQPFYWENGDWQAFEAKSGSVLPMTLDISTNLQGEDDFNQLTLRFRQDGLSAFDAFAITQTPSPTPPPPRPMARRS